MNPCSLTLGRNTISALHTSNRSLKVFVTQSVPVISLITGDIASLEALKIIGSDELYQQARVDDPQSHIERLIHAHRA
jgi:hypothetical protein